MKSTLNTFTFSFILLLMANCGYQDNGYVYNGITETVIDSSGLFIILSKDTNDWKYEITPLIEYTHPIPTEIEIGPAFPNPVSDTTFIQLTWPNQNHINIFIKDELGDIIKIINNDTLSPGYWLYSWDLKNDDGEKVPSGMYRCFYDWEFYWGIDSSFHTANGYGDIQVQ
ncbi:MAG: hypothetical protein HN657_08415 [Candidatus Marinimicrobia bacterium]|jgi:hypothetical protein|nr:hypothetical protein [Candidatus Neomarinimicrobiota bacterium]MBT3495735.1 hypothetical protein [Candidatus Neomarinimicrobiota bacterium]MBT3692456.1 hypothetical protein [Candidatus Neomarinimicrobiota bacterium]MBT3731664.1 hypothetical protein [Candidatus Neomarinimicrobiota bacterium]MBT4144493.1 hypothetical protein [Candidatus Neomarinimicrobiota bacterium]